MQRTVCIRLQLTAEQDAILSATLSASCACFNAVAALGWERRENNGVALHQATYGDLRKAHPDLRSQNVAWKYLASLGKSEASWQSVNLPIVGEGALHLSPASPRL
jgi:hypothetical protein